MLGERSLSAALLDLALLGDMLCGLWFVACGLWLGAWDVRCEMWTVDCDVMCWFVFNVLFRSMLNLRVLYR